MNAEILCNICNKPVDLTLDKFSDEENKPVHQICYEQKIIAAARTSDT